MELLLQINGVVNSIVWGPWMCAFLVGTGVYLTIILGVPQIRYFTLSFKNVFSKGAMRAMARKGPYLPLRRWLRPQELLDLGTSQGLLRLFTWEVLARPFGCGLARYLG